MSRWSHICEIVRTRAVVLRLWEAGLRALAVGLASLALAAAVRGFAATSTWPLVLLAAGLAGALAGFVWWGPRAAGRLSERRVAGEIERANPELGGRLVTAVELHGALGSTKPYELSRELAQAYLASVDEQIPDIDASRVFPARGLARSAALCAAALVAAAAVLTSNPAWAPWRRGARPAAEPEALRVRQFTRRYEYPGYSGRAPLTVADTRGLITGLKGTQVRLGVALSQPVRSLTLRFGSGESVPLLVAEGGRAASVSLVLSAPTHYGFEAATPDGASHALDGGEIAVEPDAPPLVRIVMTAPPGSGEAGIEVERTGLIEAWFEASDDFGLTEARLVAEVPGRAEPLVLARSNLDARQARGRLSFVPAEKISDPDATAFQIRVDADDNDTISGPKTGRSEPVTVRIITPERMHDRVVALQKRLLAEMVQLLGDYLELKPKAGLDPFVTVQRAMMSRLSRVIEIGALCGRMQAEDALADDNVRQSIEQMTRRREDAANRRRAWALSAEAGEGGLSEKDLAAWLAGDARETSQLESDVLLLDDLIKGQEMAAVQALARQIAESRERMEKLLQTLQQGGASPETKAAALREIEALRRRIADLAERMQQMARDLPAEFVNRDAIPRADSDRADSLSAQMEKALAEGRYEDALKLAAELSKLYENAAQAAGKGMQEWAAGTFGQGLEEARKLDQALGRLQEEQSGIVDETSKITQTHQDQVLQTREKEISEAVSAIRDKVRRADQMTGALERARRADGAEAGMDELRRSWQAVDKDLADRRLMEAQRRAAEAEAEAFQAAAEAEGDAIRGARRPPAEADGLKTAASEVTRDIDRLMRGIRQSADASAAGSEGQKMDQIGRRQQENAQALGELSRKLGETAGRSPFMDQEVPRRLETARRSMDEAAAKLGGRAASGALESERDALERLGQARENLKESIQRMTSASRLQPMPAPPSARGDGGPEGSDMRRVEVPRGESFRAPKAFREDILRILSGGLPEAFRKTNENYYRSLVE